MFILFHCYVLYFAYIIIVTWILNVIHTPHYYTKKQQLINEFMLYYIFINKN